MREEVVGTGVRAGVDGLPSGVVAFMLTDIEGSTRLWDQHPEPMARALARHEVLVGNAVTAAGGSLVRSRGEGDSLFAVFRDAPAAAQAARDVQQALAAETWPAETPIKVRIAVHVGDAELRDGDYYGRAVNRCARLRAAAHGGQTLLSGAAVDALAGRLPSGADLRDLGVHHLRDLAVMERVFQLDVDGLDADFPPLASAASNNLPAELTSFIGRDRERAEVAAMLGEHRLVTLTGSGGCGKTRLAVRVARDVLDSHPDGTWLVELAPITEAELVAQAIASVLGLREEPGRALEGALISHIRGRRMLVVLDNCEHLVAATAALAGRLLAACPELTILATSREPLGVPGEVGWRVPSLGLPDAQAADDPGEYEAVRLFLERAGASGPGSGFASGDVEAAVEICRRLDGIPLAIELAAARVGVLSPRQIADRLGDRFQLLTGGNRVSVRRQQTLRAAVDWSYELLSDPERTVLGRLSVFSGGCGLEAAEEVCAGGGILAADVLDILGQLVSKSLVGVERQGAESRYRMLETIRQYGRERLLESGAEAETVARHRDWCLDLAEDAEQELLRGHQVSWERLEAEHDNLRAALESSLADPAARDAALRLAGALGEFWDLRCYLAEGRRWLETALAGSERLPAASRAKALSALGLLIAHQGHYREARSRFEEGLVLARRAGDQQVVATTLGNFGWMVFSEGHATEARTYLEEGVELARELGDKWIIARAIYLLCHVEAVERPEVCLQLAGESLALARELGERSIEARSVYFLGVTAIWQGRYDEARVWLEQSVALATEVGDRWQAPWSMAFMASMNLLLGRNAEAREPFERSLAVARETGNLWCVARCLGGLAWVTLLVDGDPLRAHELALESLSLARDIGTRVDTALALSFLAEFARAQGQFDDAVRYHREALSDNVMLHNRWGIAGTLERLARIRVDRGDYPGATRFLAAATRIRDEHGCPIAPIQRGDYERTVRAARAALTVDFDQNWSEGREMPLEEVIEEAMAA